MSLETKFQRLRPEVFPVGGFAEGGARKGLPMRKCPVVRYEPSSKSLEWRGAKSLEFKIALASVRMV